MAIAPNIFSSDHRIARAIRACMWRSPQHLAALDNEARALIGQADSFFVASYAQTAQGLRADVSHRGGRPGFVRIDDDGTLTIPDFAGNQFFSTLGNISETGKAGLVFIDWSKGDVLQISGEAMVLLDRPKPPDFRVPSGCGK
ncbi:pyridoxamine 5'-phosphate oxidase family protein [Novosphingobium pokkalii]|uniref:pyridoxamine 5'-phosphate oxidase family protein n=1 Tax=Novosphingobium pokkalii TaxID=1770194 RepID=UPI00362C7BCE